MAKKKLNKFVVPQEYNQSVVFAKGGNLYGIGDYLSVPTTGVTVTGGPDLNKITQQGVQKLNAASSIPKITSQKQTPGIGLYLGAAQGVMQLGSQAINNFDTSGIGKEVQNVNDISRGDIINTSVVVDSNQSNVAGQALSGAMTGASAGAAFGGVGALVGGGIGALAGGLSSKFGNDKKEDAANKAETM